MYEAYSAKRGHIVDAKNALDYKEIYHCPNPSCSALYKLRSITGDRATHFARLPSTPHSSDCIYEYAPLRIITGVEDTRPMSRLETHIRAFRQLSQLIRGH